MISKHRMKKLKFVLLLLLIQSAPVFPVNWLMLQGVEAPNINHRLFVFAQPSYTKDLGSEISAGPNSGKRAASSTVAPWFEDDAKFHFRRARAGVRGNFTGLLENNFSSKMNYFVLAEFAPNLLTYRFMGPKKRKLALDHLSLTFNHIKGARLRLGLFKTPGLEETYQGVVAQDYIEFTDFAAREVLERFATGNTRMTPSGGSNENIGTPVNISHGFNGARDWGVQVFESFKQDDWDYSYAFMLGRGTGIHESDRVQNMLEQYYYLSAEQDLPGGKGPWKHGIKYYAWLQNGERIFSSDPQMQIFERKRYGLGVRGQGSLFSMKAKQRLAIDLMFADGMIFVAPVGAVKGGDLMFAAQGGNRSRALSIDYGYFIMPKWELMFRWDKHELLYETDDRVWTQGDARDIKTMTYGIAHHVNPKLKFTFNFIDRKLTAPYEDHPVVDNVLNSIGQRYSFQLIWVY